LKAFNPLSSQGARPLVGRPGPRRLNSPRDRRSHRLRAGGKRGEVGFLAGGGWPSAVVDVERVTATLAALGSSLAPTPLGGLVTNVSGATATAGAGAVAARALARSSCPLGKPRFSATTSAAPVTNANSRANAGQ
jgi:hypothetical protein